jgi:ferrous iron transport protein B
MMNKKVIALAGNPNCGKTTLFNGLTGGNVKTGNWPGVTVEKREGVFTDEGGQVTVVDLPGIYSFSAHSEDEKIARDYILSGEPSLIVNIIDATNLERNLYLTAQLIEMKVPIVVVVNMMDLAEKGGQRIDLDGLSKRLSLPVVGASAVRAYDVRKVKDLIREMVAVPVVSGAEVRYPNEVEAVVGAWQDRVAPVARKLSVDSRWISLKLLENDVWITHRVTEAGELSAEEVKRKREDVERVLGDPPDVVCADYRYGFVNGVARRIVKKDKERRSFTDKADRIVLNRILGIPIFLAVMYLVFWVTTSVGGAFIDFFDGFFGTIFVDGFGALLSNLGVPSWLTIILADGVGGGLQTVATFVPVIFMMFMMLAILEDSGYMARAAFVMDRFMKVLGLPGKAFIPMLVGFGCTVPAVMATRTLDSKRDRFLTIFLTPFMSCGAWLPVYALFAAAFFPRHGGLVVFVIYLVGIVLAVLTGLLLKKTLFRGEQSYFVMELPPYHRPRVRHILSHAWDRLRRFVFRAGKVIVLVVALLAVLNSLGTDGTIGNEDSDRSVLAAVGKTITPVFEPMGVERENWPATVGLFTGIFAKEAVVGTLNSLYGQITAAEESGDEGDRAREEAAEEAEEPFDFWSGLGDAFFSVPEGLAGIFGGLTDPMGAGIVGEEDEETLAEEIGADTTVFGRMRDFFKGPWQAFAYLLFILLYFPCVAAFGAVVKETGILFGIVNAVYLTVLAWITSTLVYQIAVGHQAVWIVVPLLLMGALVGGLFLLRRARTFRNISIE